MSIEGEMIRPMSDEAEAQARFDRLAAKMANHDGVTLGSGRRGFGSGALHVNGRIFAMLSAGRLVVKLPSDRVTSLISNGGAAPFDAGKGRPMKEWAAIRHGADDVWLARAEEARAFVSSPASRP
jgi:hypothetical protein